MTVMFPKSKRLKSKKLTNSARGEECTLQIFGVCNHNPETTVFGHIGGAGIALKDNDIHGCYICSSCHSWLDGGYVKTPNFPTERRKLLELEAVIKTQKRMIQKGLIIRPEDF